MASNVIAQGAPYEHAGVFDWDTVTPWSPQAAVTHRLIRAPIKFSQFTDAVQVQTEEVYNTAPGKAVVVRDAWWYGVQSWDDAKGLTISVGLNLDDDAILLPINDTDTTAATFFGDIAAAKGTKLSSPATPIVVDSKAGVTVTVDAGGGNLCSDLTKGFSVLYLEIVEFDV
jgi:hypothetical protein